MSDEDQRQRLGLEVGLDLSRDPMQQLDQSVSAISSDSPLEGAVTSELVSGYPEFPASWENTGNFIDFSLGRPDLRSKRQ
jgi:hypothetical protein